MEAEKKNMEYFELDPGLRASIQMEYSGPLYGKMAIFVLIQIFIFIFFTFGMGAHKDIYGMIEVGLFRSPRSVKLPYTHFVWGQVIFHVLMFIAALESFGKINLGLYKDAQSGKGIKEVITITEIMYTPACPVYITNSPVLKTITDETALCIGDELTIYYLEFSGRLLYIEPEIKRKDQEKSC